MSAFNFGSWFESMRINHLPLSIFLVALSSQITVVGASNDFIGNVSKSPLASRQKYKLDEKSISYLRNACVDAVQLSSDRLLRELNDHLMNSFNATDSFELQMQRADALLACKSPANAQKVLQGINPVTVAEQKVWSILFWQASNASMDHSSASLALRRLSEGNLQQLDREQMTVAYGADGSPLTRSALDLLAEHERLNGRCEAAAKVLLAGRKSGALGASRISRAVQCLEGIGIEQRKDLLESALAEANADKAWWLVGDILRLQLVLDLAAGGEEESYRTRLEEFAKELDDRFTQWELIRIDQDRKEERTLLEDQLRSPRENAIEVEKIQL